MLMGTLASVLLYRSVGTFPRARVTARALSTSGELGGV